MNATATLPREREDISDYYSCARLCRRECSPFFAGLILVTVVWPEALRSLNDTSSQQWEVSPGMRSSKFGSAIANHWRTRKNNPDVVLDSPALTLAPLAYGPRPTQTVTRSRLAYPVWCARHEPSTRKQIAYGPLTPAGKVDTYTQIAVTLTDANHEPFARVRDANGTVYVSVSIIQTAPRKPSVSIDRIRRRLFGKGNKGR
jgi:hypothetical protein